MALVNSRSGIGGRKPIELVNPFIYYNEWEEPVNILLHTEHKLDIRIEDILVGCIRSVDTDSSNKGDTVDWRKVLRVYRTLHHLSYETIQKYLNCSRSTAFRYVRVIKLANPFIKRLLEGKSGSNVVGYVDFSTSQVEDGFLDILMEIKPKERVKKVSNKQTLGETICTIITQ